MTPNWDVALTKFANYQRGRAFVWGSTDCATLTRQALKVIHDEDKWDGFVKRYYTKKGALLFARNADPENVLIASGGRQVGRGFATAGDVALAHETDDHGLPAVSILLCGCKVLYSTVEDGVTIVSQYALSAGTRFYRYG